MAALEPPTDQKKASKYVSVMVEHDKSDYMICTLEPNRNLQVQLDLMFVEGEEVTYYLSGEGTVHLTGYLVPDPYDEFDEEEEDEEVSDEELELNGLPKKVHKRKNETLDSSTESIGKKAKLETKPIKDKKPNESDKNSNKKKDLVSDTKKNLNVVNNKDSDDDSEDDDEEEDEESDDDMDDSIGLLDKEAVEVGDSEDDEEEDEEESDSELDEEKSSPIKDKSKGKPEAQKPQNQKFQQKPQQNQQKPQQHNQFNQKSPQNQQNNKKQFGSDKKFGNQQKAGFGGQQQKGFQQQRGGFNQSFNSGQKNQNQKGGNQWQNRNQSGNQGNSPNFGKGGNQTPNRGGGGQQKGGFNQSPKFSGQKETPKHLPNTKQRRLSGGIIVEDIVEGSGLNARKGKFVHLNYVGRLPDNKVFDRTHNKPFSFRLGTGEVIKGWDIGIQDMKVGGKRKIIIPPNMGYGNRSVGSIPANSTLQFEVELKSVT